MSNFLSTPEPEFWKFNESGLTRGAQECLRYFQIGCACMRVSPLSVTGTGLVALHTSAMEIVWRF